MSMYLMFAVFGIFAAHATFVGIGLALDASEMKARANMRYALREMEGGRL